MAHDNSAFVDLRRAVAPPAAAAAADPGGGLGLELLGGLHPLGPGPGLRGDLLGRALHSCGPAPGGAFGPAFTRAAAALSGPLLGDRRVPRVIQRRRRSGGGSTVSTERRCRAPAVTAARTRTPTLRQCRHRFAIEALAAVHNVRVLE